MESLVFAAILVLLSLLAPSASQEANTTLPLIYHPRTAEGGEQVCSPDKERLQAITRNDLSNLLRNNLPTLAPCTDRNLGQLEHCPAVSSSDIDAKSQVLRPSGYYWIINSSGTTVRSYCDMDVVLCNQGRGTTQTNPADSCRDVIYTPAPLVITGLRAQMKLQCRSTVTWTGCVVATAMEGGHVLPTST